MSSQRKFSPQAPVHLPLIYCWYPLHYVLISEVSIFIEIKIQNEKKLSSHDFGFNDIDASGQDVCYPPPPPELLCLPMFIYFTYNISKLDEFLFQYIKQIPELKESDFTALFFQTVYFWDCFDNLIYSSDHIAFVLCARYSMSCARHYLFRKKCVSFLHPL